MLHSFRFRLFDRQPPTHEKAATSSHVSADFLINGESLLHRLAEATDGDTDFKGFFWHGFQAQNKATLARLLCQAPPETADGRVLLYVCPECGDIGCGAYAARVKVGPASVQWCDFAYENGRDSPSPIAGVGPFNFDPAEYKSTVAAASEA